MPPRHSKISCGSEEEFNDLVLEYFGTTPKWEETLLDTQFAREVTKKYHPEFLRLMDAHLPHGNVAYQDLYAQMSGELESVYGKEAGKAVSEAGASTIAMMLEMIELAYPKVIVPIDHK